MVLNITVKTLDSQNYQIEAADEWTVQQFKEHIQPVVNVAPNEQRLIFCGRVLQDDKKLTDYDCNDKVIHLVKRAPPPIINNPTSSTADSNNNSNNYHEGSMESPRLLNEGNVLISALTLSPESISMNINHLSRDPNRRVQDYSPIFLRATAMTNHGNSLIVGDPIQQNLNQQSQHGEPSRSSRALEGSVTITTSSETSPIIASSSTPPSIRPLVNATIIVSAEPGQPPLRIPVPVPIPLGPHGSISMEFTPTVIPQQETSSANSSGTQTEQQHQQQQPNQQSEQQEQQSSTQQDPNTPQQQSTTTNSTQTAPRVGVISGRVPLPFDYLLLCFSHWGNYSTVSRTVAQAPSRVNDSGWSSHPARIHLRQQLRQPFAPSNQSSQLTTGQNNPPTTATTTASTPNPTNRTQSTTVLDGGLTEVVSNIVGSFFRPQQNDQTTQGTNTSPNQDPLLNIIPELALTAASHILGGVLGLPGGINQGRSHQNQPTDRAQDPSTSTSVMMEIDIDDGISIQSDSQVHDTRSSNSSASNVSHAQSSSRPSSSQLSTHSGPSRELTSTSTNLRYSRQQLVEVLRNRPDWIPIIEADITLMERQRTITNNRPLFSDAYLNSIPRKRRRLLATDLDQVLILQPSPSQAITNLLRRAITSSVSMSIGSLEQVLGTISDDTNLQSAYEEHIKFLVEKRLKTDYDYSPTKFTNSNKYFKQ